MLETTALAPRVRLVLSDRASLGGVPRSVCRCARHSAGRVHALRDRVRRLLLGPSGRAVIARAWFVPKFTLFVRKSSNGQNRLFGPSGEAPPKLILAWRAPTGQSFAEGFAQSERRILDQTYAVYTDSASVVYRSVVFEMSKVAAAKAMHRSKVRWSEKPICIRSVVARSEESQVRVNACAKPTPTRVRRYRYQPALATS